VKPVRRKSTGYKEHYAWEGNTHNCSEGDPTLIINVFFGIPDTEEYGTTPFRNVRNSLPVDMI